jgi:hypothetical protein
MNHTEDQPRHTRGQLLTERQLAARWQVAAGHLANLRSAGAGPVFIRLGRAVRYRVDDIEAHEAAARIETAA